MGAELFWTAAAAVIGVPSAIFLLYDRWPRGSLILECDPKNVIFCEYINESNQLNGSPCIVIYSGCLVNIGTKTLTIKDVRLQGKIAGAWVDAERAPVITGMINGKDGPSPTAVLILSNGARVALMHWRSLGRAVGERSKLESGARVSFSEAFVVPEDFNPDSPMRVVVDTFQGRFNRRKQKLRLSPSVPHLDQSLIAGLAAEEIVANMNERARNEGNR